MSNKTLAEWVAAQPDGGRVFEQERLIVETTEHIWALMERQGVSKTMLATTLGRSKAYISQLLNGTRNMTLRTLADIAGALGCAAHVHFDDRDIVREWQPVRELLFAQRRRTVTAADVAVCNDGEWSPRQTLAPFAEAA